MPNFPAPEISNVLSRLFVIEDLKDESLKETCLKEACLMINFRMDGWMDGRKHGQTHRWMDGRTNGRTDERIDWTDRQI